MLDDSAIYINNHPLSLIELLVVQDIERIIIQALYQRLGIEVIVIPLSAKGAQHETVLSGTDGLIMPI